MCGSKKILSRPTKIHLCCFLQFLPLRAGVHPHPLHLRNELSSSDIVLAQGLKKSGHLKTKQNLCMWAHCLHVRMSVYHVSGARRGQQMSGQLELGLRS